MRLSKKKLTTWQKVTLFILMFFLVTFVFKTLFLKNTITVDYVAPLMGNGVPGERVQVRLLAENEKKSVSRGSIVYYRVEQDDGYSRKPGNYISRVVGLPGERVRMEESKLFVNDVEVAEPYFEYPSSTATFSEIVIPENTYLLIGDSRGTTVPVPKFVVFATNIIGIIQK